MDCFLERLDRPLTVLGVASVFSLQPAVGARSPRIFIFDPGLVMSVVPAGMGSPYLELAEYTTPLRSIKAQTTCTKGGQVILSSDPTSSKVRPSRE